MKPVFRQPRLQQSWQQNVVLINCALLVATLVRFICVNSSTFCLLGKILLSSCGNYRPVAVS